eukprot:UC4_evm1s348
MLKGRDCAPKVINFKQYTKQQLVDIISARLFDIPDSILSPRAIDFCAAKVTSISGDLRRALDVCRQAIDTIERAAADAKKKDCPPPPQASHIKHILDVFKCTMGGDKIRTIRGLPLHQKLL